LRKAQFDALFIMDEQWPEAYLGTDYEIRLNFKATCGEIRILSGTVDSLAAPDHTLMPQM
jgi:hypothetical protein